MRTHSKSWFSESKWLLLLLSFVLLFSTLVPAQTNRSRPRAQKQKQTQPEVIPEPVVPAPLPSLPPPLSAQALPYPREFIRRPYTLPADLNDLTIRASAVNTAVRSDTVDFPLYLAEVVYRKPLSSDFNLVFNPLPLGLQYQQKRTDSVLTGVSWAVGWQFQGNIGLFPQFTSFLRYFLSDKSALELELHYGTFVAFKKGPSIWRAYFRMGPLFQYSERLAISPRLYLWVDNVALSEAYRPTRARIEEPALTDKSSQFQIPLSLWAGWSLTPKIDLTADYQYLGLGLGGGDYAHVVTAGFTTRW